MTVERFFIKEAKKAYDIENYLRETLSIAGFSHAEVKRTPLGTRIIIHALRPGIVIGGGGSNIKKLTVEVGSRFGVENPHLEVEQIREASLDPHVVAWRIARSLEKGAYFKRVANITMQRVVQAGAKGVEIRLGGKLPSARSKTWIFTSGKLRKCGQDAIDQVQIAYAKAMTRPGVIGVKVSILAPDATFSDEITFRVEPEKKEVKRVIETVEIKEEEQPLEIPAGTPETPKDVEPEVEPIVEVSTESTEVVNEETPVEKPVEESKKVVDEKIQDNKKTPTEK